MQINYQWHIEKVEKITTEQFTDFISKIHWKCVGITLDGKYAAEYKGSFSFDISRKSLDKLIPFPEVTYDDMGKWVKKGIKNRNDKNDGYYDMIMGKITKEIEAKIQLNTIKWKRIWSKNGNTDI